MHSSAKIYDLKLFLSFQLETINKEYIKYSQEATRSSIVQNDRMGFGHANIFNGMSIKWPARGIKGNFGWGQRTKRERYKGRSN